MTNHLKKLNEMSECSSDLNNNNIIQPTAHSGIKLVLKRQSDNNYQIQKINELNRARPKRAASRKVKFRFSEPESDDENSQHPSRAKRPKIYHKTIVKQPILVIHQEPEPIKVIEPIIKEYLSETLLEFNTNDLIQSSYEDKVNALQTRPIVLVEHSTPFPICLVEDKTNIVATKAVLLIHLFQSLAAQCIGCPVCRSFMNISEFSKHIHPDFEDEESDDENKKIKRNESDSEQEDSNETKAVKSYKILPYTSGNELNESDIKIWKLFGQRFSEFKKKKPIIESITAKKIEIKPKEEIKPQKCEFNDWEYVNTTNDVYMLTEDKIDSDQIVYLNKNGDNLDANMRVFGFNENQSDDLNLSESEDDVPLLNEKQIEQKQIVLEPIPQQSNRSNQQKPTLKELYFNLYENLSKDKLFYLVDNQYTIIPDSYIIYINKKREIYFQQLKLANSTYYQKKWLNLSLDLEFNIN